MLANIDDASQETSEEGFPLFGRFFLLFVLGFSLVVVGFTIVTIATMLYGVYSPSFNAVIFIGPFPIVFGAGSDSGLMIMAGLLLAVLIIVLFWVVNRKV